MKIAIFGATGRTGLPLIEQALTAGYQVVAFVRDPAKLTIQNEHLTVVQGDVLNKADVAKAITSDLDAVISVLAPVKGSPKDLMPLAASHIIAAMKQQGVKRLIYMTGAGVDFPEDKPKLFDKLIKFALKTMAGDVLKQSELGVREVQNSGLEWVIPRGPMLNNNPHTGKYRVGWVGVNTGSRLSRADAADFILKQIKGNTYLRKAPALSN